MKQAAETFLFLQVVPGLTKPWFVLYKNIFQTHSPDKIILTLKRLIGTNAPKNEDLKIIAEKLFEKTAELLSLQYNNIQSYYQEEETCKPKVIRGSKV